MPQDHRLQLQRFELKYLLPESRTGALRDFLQSYLELDDYTARRADRSYDVHSVYLDSEDLHTHHATINGNKNRFKLRLRYYSGHPDAPVFAEIKQRVDNCILKRRCPIRRDAVPLLLNGHLPEPDQVCSQEARHHAALHRFYELQSCLNARPKLHNNYRREAWVSPHDNAIRVTFDRQIRVEPYFGTHAATTMKRPTRIYPSDVVLELKFTTRYPKWFQELVQRFGLMRATASKFCGGVSFLGEHRFGPEGRSTEVHLDALAEDQLETNVESQEAAAPALTTFETEPETAQLYFRK